jgi:DNA-directed RNA polymerase subunit RPC12/RpoP
MGYKKVCFNCRKAFTISNLSSLACPECGGNTILFNHKFRPPKKDDFKKWDVVEFLKDEGFDYQHVYRKADDSNGYISVRFPETMKEAKEFATKYKKKDSFDIY